MDSALSTASAGANTTLLLLSPILLPIFISIRSGVSSHCTRVTDDRRLYDGIGCLQSTLHGQKMGDSKRVNVPNFSRGAERIIMSFYLDDAFYTNHNVLTVLTHHTCSIQLLRDISNNSLLLVTIVVRRQANIVQTFVFFIKFDQQQNFVV